jgi:hypothetical protein
MSENPKVLAGSESESKKNVGFGYGFESRYCCRMKFFVKNGKIKHLKERKCQDQTLERKKMGRSNT